MSGVADPLVRLAAAAWALTLTLLVTTTAAASETCISAAVRARLRSCDPGLADLDRAAGATGEGTTKDQRSSPLRRRGLEVAPRPITRRGQLTTLHHQLCSTGPSGGPVSPRERVRLTFARGKLYHEAHRWEEAAADFRAAAMADPTAPEAILAAQLYLDTLNILGSRIDPARLSCYDHMAADVPKLLEQHCDGPPTAVNREACGTFRKIIRDILRLKAENQIKLADEMPPAKRDRAARHYERAAEQYLAIWRDHYRADCEAKQASCRYAEEVLFNAARAFRHAGKVFKAIQVSKALLDPRFGLQRTEPAIRASYEIGRYYMAMGMFELAASWYERFVLEHPKREQAPTALSDALVLRLSLGQGDQAAANASHYQRLYSRTKPGPAAKVAAAIGAYHVEQADWKRADRRLSRTMSAIVAQTTADVSLPARCHLAQAKLALGDGAAADRLYRQVMDSWTTPKRRQKLMASLDLSQPGDMRRLGKVLTAVAEGLLHFSRQSSARANGMTRPPFRGPPTRGRLQSYLQTHLAPWLAARQKAIQEAEKAYVRIPMLRPHPPPGAVVEAAAEVAGMWANLMDELRGPPYAAAATGATADEQWYRQQVDRLAARPQARAKMAHITCLGYSAKYMAGNEQAARCRGWLSRHYPTEFLPVLEILPAPAHRSAALSEQWPGLLDPRSTDR